LSPRDFHQLWLNAYGEGPEGPDRGEAQYLSLDAERPGNGPAEARERPLWGSGSWPMDWAIGPASGSIL
jgi:hypothetical protein